MNPPFIQSGRSFRFSAPRSSRHSPVIPGFPVFRGFETTANSLTGTDSARRDVSHKKRSFIPLDRAIELPLPPLGLIWPPRLQGVAPDNERERESRDKKSEARRVKKVKELSQDYRELPARLQLQSQALASIRCSSRSFPALSSPANASCPPPSFCTLVRE